MNNYLFENFWATFWPFLGTIWLHLGGLGEGEIGVHFQRDFGGGPGDPGRQPRLRQHGPGRVKGRIPGPITSVPDGYRTRLRTVEL